MKPAASRLRKGKSTKALPLSGWLTEIDNPEFEDFSLLSLEDHRQVAELMSKTGKGTKARPSPDEKRTRNRPWSRAGAKRDRRYGGRVKVRDVLTIWPGSQGS